ncbi:unnamed protein product [Rhizoctonia solani]|uniref:Deuterolysin metalloprotease (M35) family containing protein n=1 Tax=Rhizoctonia solani TaxID=456999 RepID=A0A8H3C0Q1_9AGAM|nr:unnamed protein product [Rhizoctonia solani]
MHSSGSNFNLTSVPCRETPVYTGPLKHNMGEHIKYECRSSLYIQSGTSISSIYYGRFIAYEYSMEVTEEISKTNSLDTGYSLHQVAKDYAPAFWLQSYWSPSRSESAANMSQNTDPASYLAPLIQPEFGSYTAHIRTRSNSNILNRATGLIYGPLHLRTSEHTSQAHLTLGKRPYELCEVTEDYRTTSAFDILASIGGLLALLQGVHILIFGRPLFWGMFGAKLIAPFGLAGNLATNAFRKRLQERYHIPAQTRGQAEPGSDPNGPQPDVKIDMTQFLLDFVVDMGPASVPTSTRGMHGDESSDTDAEENDNKSIRRLGDLEGVEVTELEWRNTTRDIIGIAEIEE